MSKLRQVKKVQRNLIRIFLSSTFRDMTKEREYLNKVIFPELRLLTRKRGVGFSAIDLRWGVTEAEANQGEVLSICLEEIDRCKPFFIGFLGERYGWVPTKEDVRCYKHLTERFPITEICLKSGLSITEMEILHGVLESEGEVRASFYQRDPNLTEQLAQGREKSIYFEEKDIAQVKLQNLKERISDSEYPVHNYDSIQEMGQQIKADLLTLLDELYPVSEIPDPVEAKKRLHRLHAEDRISFYFPNDNVIQALQDYVERSQQAQKASKPLLVTGPSGRGKSSLVSYWVTKLMEENPNQWVIEHYVGVGDDYVQVVLSRIINEIRKVIAPKNTEQLPNNFDDLCEVFSSWLDRITRDNPLLLVIDAINQISGPHLSWIPTVLPPNVTCVLSTLPGQEEEWLKECDAELLEVPALDLEARQAITEGYLARYRKKLSQVQLNKVVQAKPCESPLFLTSVLAELAIFGSFVRLTSYIDHLVSSNDLDELFECMITRFEEDYGSELTKEVLTTLWSCGLGLSEDELVEITNFKLVEVSKITIALGQHLNTNGHFIRFTHRYLQSSIEKRYLAEQSSKRNQHLKLASWFEKHTTGERRALILGLQYLLARAWKDHYRVLTDPILGPETLQSNDMAILYLNWIEVARALEVKIENVYERLWEEEQLWQRPEIEERLLAFLNYGDYATSFQQTLCKKYLDRKIELAQKIGTTMSYTDVSDSFKYLGDIALKNGNLNEALTAYKEGLSIDRSLAKKLGTEESLINLCSSLNNMGKFWETKREFEKAAAVFHESLEVRRFNAQKFDSYEAVDVLCNSLYGYGMNKFTLGFLEEPLSIFKEGLAISRSFVERVDNPETQRRLSVFIMGIGQIAKARGELDEAFSHYQEGLKIRKSLIAKYSRPNALRDLYISLICIGDLVKAQRDINEALIAYQQSIEVSNILLNYSAHRVV